MPHRLARGLPNFLGGLLSPFWVSINPLSSFRTLANILILFLKKNLKKNKNCPPDGQGRGELFFWLESSYFCDLGAHAKFRNPTTTPYGVLNNGGEKIKEIKFPLAPMGVLAPGSAHTRPSAQPPIDTSGIFFAQNFQKTT